MRGEGWRKNPRLRDEKKSHTNPTEKLPDLLERNRSKMSTASASSARHEIIGAAREGYREAVAGFLETDDTAASLGVSAGS